MFASEPTLVLNPAPVLRVANCVPAVIGVPGVPVNVSTTVDGFAVTGSVPVIAPTLTSEVPVAASGSDESWTASISSQMIASRSE